MILAPTGARRALRVLLADFSLRNLADGIREAAAGMVVALVVLPLILADGFGGIGGAVAVLACACVLLSALGTLLAVAFNDPIGRLRTASRTPARLPRVS